MKAVRGNTSLLPSLAGVKGPSGCAVRRNSKSDLVQGLVFLELEEQPIASLALGLLYWRSSRQVLATFRIFSHCPKSHAGWSKVSRRDSSLNGHALGAWSVPETSKLPPTCGQRALTVSVTASCINRRFSR